MGLYSVKGYAKRGHNVRLQPRQAIAERGREGGKTNGAIWKIALVEKFRDLDRNDAIVAAFLYGQRRGYNARRFDKVRAANEARWGKDTSNESHGVQS